MNSVRLYYIKLAHQNEITGDESSRLHDSLTPEQLEHWLNEVSDSKRASVERLKNFNDRCVSLLGMQLLKQCARDEGVSDFHLADVIYPDSGKPYWSKSDADVSAESVDFNITHSAEFIAVACSRTLQLGLDAEKIKPLKNLKFKMVMNEKELKEIEEAPDSFFDLWSIKEAVVKAANTSGLARMRDVIIEHDHAMLDGRKWSITALANDVKSNDYSVHLATSNVIDHVIIKQLSLEEMVTSESVN